MYVVKASRLRPKIFPMLACDQLGGKAWKWTAVICRLQALQVGQLSGRETIASRLRHRSPQQESWRSSQLRVGCNELHQGWSGSPALSVRPIAVLSIIASAFAAKLCMGRSFMYPALQLCEASCFQFAGKPNCASLMSSLDTTGLLTGGQCTSNDVLY